MNYNRRSNWYNNNNNINILILLQNELEMLQYASPLMCHSAIEIIQFCAFPFTGVCKLQWLHRHTANVQHTIASNICQPVMQFAHVLHSLAQVIDWKDSSPKWPIMCWWGRKKTLLTHSLIHTLATACQLWALANSLQSPNWNILILPTVIALISFRWHHVEE